MKYTMFILAILVPMLTVSLAQNVDEQPKNKAEEVSYTQLRAFIDGNQISRAAIATDGSRVTIVLNDGATLFARVTPETPIADRLADAGIKTWFTKPVERQQTDMDVFLAMFGNLMPLLIFFIFIAFLVFVYNSLSRRPAVDADPFLEKIDDANKDFFSRLEALQREFLEELKVIIQK